MDIPSAVKKQADEAERLLKELLEGEGATQTEETETQESQEQQSEKDEKVEQTEHEASTEGELVEEEAGDWEARYKTLQGKYNAEIPNLKKSLDKVLKENEQLKTKLTVMEELLRKQDELQTKAVSGIKETEPEEEPPEIKEIKDTFPEIYNFVTSHFVPKKELTQSVYKEIENKYKHLYNELLDVKLTSLVPDWKELNTNPDFLSWLKEIDYLSGKTKHELLLEAYEKGEINRVAQFFNAFKTQNQQTHKDENSQKAQPKLQQTIVPPNRSASQTNVGSGTKRMFTLTEINQFFRDLALGKIPQDKRAILEKDIYEAFKEGRVLDK